MEEKTRVKVVPAEAGRVAMARLQRDTDLVTGIIEVCREAGFEMTDPERPVFHVHGVVTDADGKAWGGHFFKGGNPVHATVDIVMNEIKGGYMKWTQDDEIDLELPVPYSK